MQIHRVPTPPSRDAAPHPLSHAAVRVEARSLTAEYGHGDFVDSLRLHMVRLFGSAYEENHVWVALRDGADPESCTPEDGLGLISVGLPLKEDTDKAFVRITTDPDHRGRGIAKALLEAVTPWLDERRRTLVHAWVFYPGVVATGPDVVPARSGTGAGDGRHPATTWLLRLGFSLEQCERISTLTLDGATRRRAEALAAEARATAPAASGYELVWWSDETPAEHVDGLAWLVSRMSTDVPMADLALEEQAWDAERLLDSEEQARVAGIRWVLTAARHRDTGRLVGFTRFEWAEENPAGVWQQETVVLDEHRGHRLGMLVKTANVARLGEVNPAARRAHTWNAAENRWMLAINDALGFVPVGREGAWQRKL